MNSNPTAGWAPPRPAPMERKARKIYRILAGLIAVFLLGVGLPAALAEIDTGGWKAWLGMLGCFWGGIGMAVGSWTGRWPVPGWRTRPWA